MEPRKEPSFSYRLLRDLSRVSGAVHNQVIPADDLAKAMVEVAVRGSSERESLVFDNRDIRAIVKPR